MGCKREESFFASRRVLSAGFLLALFFGCVALLFLNPLRSESWSVPGFPNAETAEAEALKQDAAIAFGVVPCQDNTACGTQQFCNLDVSSTGYSHEMRPGRGYCRSNQAKTAGGWVLSVFYMDFWSVDAFCASHGLKRATLAELGCSEQNIQDGRCDSPILKDLYRQLEAYYVWSDQQKDAQYGYNIDLSSGTVNFDFMDNAGHALCR